MGEEASDAVGKYLIYRVQSGGYNFDMDELPEEAYPDPLYQGNNLARVGRISASSMHIETEKLPGFEAFKANDGDQETMWMADGCNNKWLQVEWVKPQIFDRVIVHEKGENIQACSIQYFSGDVWQTIATDKVCRINKAWHLKT